jgi:hypothetical protein
MPPAAVDVEYWTMYFDGSLVKEGAGLGFVFISTTLDFKDKTECITICIPGSSSIHLVTSSVNNQQQYHAKKIKRL